MKKFSLVLVCLLALCPLVGCNSAVPAQIAATTLPVYEFTAFLCQDTDITVTRLITENVSCLHDYSLQVTQMRAIESADWIVISGAGLEEFMHDILADNQNVIDASIGIELLCPEAHHNHAHHDEHSHENDPHIWLSVSNAKQMAQNIFHALITAYPEKHAIISENWANLKTRFDDLESYGKEVLADLPCRELITFHDGFAYFADEFNLQILKAIEEESGSEASAAELTELIHLARNHSLPAIFTEINGSTSAAQIIHRETGIPVFPLDMAMASGSYFDAMYHNIKTIKEALG